VSRRGREPGFHQCDQSNAHEAVPSHRMFGAAARLGTGKRKGAVEALGRLLHVFSFERA
jgi:hypothetical protein